MANPTGVRRLRRKLALIIANGEYSQPQHKIRQSIKNARGLEQALNDVGFLTTAHHNVAADDELRRSVIDFARTIDDDDLIFVFFSGHSCQVDGANYLIPTQDEQIGSGNDVVDIATPVDSLLRRLLEPERLCLFIIVLDCCRPYRLSDESGSSSRVHRKGLCKIKPRTNMLIQYACAPNKVNSNNLYFDCLLKAVTEENVNLIDVFQQVVDDVDRQSEQKQIPFLKHRINTNEEIYLNEVIYSQIVLPVNARWHSEGRTVTGGRNHNSGPGHKSNNLRSPQGLLLRSAQTVAVADTLHHSTIERKQESRLGRRIAGNGIAGYGPNTLCAPSDIVFHEQSNSYLICDYHNQRVVRKPPRRDASLKTLIGNIECSAIAVDNDGFIYVSDTEYHVVRRYNSDGAHGTIVAGGHGQGSRLHQLNHPTYIFVGLDKSVYVSDSWNNRVMKWERGAKVGTVVAGGNGKGKNLNQLDCPAGLAVDRRGTVYVADHWNHRVMRWPKDRARIGVVVGDHYTSGDTTNHLNGPQGLGFDSDGNLYVTDSDNHRIQQFAIRQ